VIGAQYNTIQRQNELTISRTSYSVPVATWTVAGNHRWTLLPNTPL